MSRIRTHLTYANVMVTVLLFIVLGGGAYALQGKNSVRSDDIKNGEVKTADLDGSAVTSQKVKNDSLKPGDIDSTVASPHGSGDVQTGPPFTPVSYPLSGNTWTQPAGEVEMISGTVTYKTPPTTCFEFGSEGSSYGYGLVELAVGELDAGKAYLTPLPENQVRTRAFVHDPLTTAGSTPQFLFAPATNTPRVMVATAEDNCDDDNFTIQSIDIEVVGVG